MQMYGVTKVHQELLGAYYHARFGVVSHVAGGGGRGAHVISSVW